MIRGEVENRFDPQSIPESGAHAVRTLTIGLGLDVEGFRRLSACGPSMDRANGRCQAREQ